MGSGYLSLLAPIMAVAFASFVIYDSERLKASRFALGIILLAAVISPLGAAIKGFANMDFVYTGEDYSSSAVEKTLEEAFCDGISRAVCEKFSINTENVSVISEGFDDETMKAELIFLYLSGSAVTADYGSIEDYVNSLGLGKCILEVYFG